MIDLSNNKLSLVLDIAEGGAVIIKSFGNRSPTTMTTSLYISAVLKFSALFLLFDFILLSP